MSQSESGHCIHIYVSQLKITIINILRLFFIKLLFNQLPTHFVIILLSMYEIYTSINDFGNKKPIIELLNS